MKNNTLKQTLAMGILLGVLSTSFGKGISSEKDWQLDLGLIAAANTSYYKGADPEYWVLPLIIAEYKQFYFRGVEAGFKLYEFKDGSEFTMVSAFTYDGYDADDSTYLSGMKDRKSALEAGFSYINSFWSGEFEARFMNDLGTSHEGYSVRVDYERRLLSTEKNQINWYAGLEYWDKRRTNYYFGINESEATSDRPAYSPSGNVSCFLGLNAVRRINERYSLFASVEYRTSGGTVSDSPIVARNDQVSGYIGLSARL